MELENMTQDERSLLLYLETCAVDNTGRVDQKKLNDADRSAVAEWAESGFIDFGRIVFADCTNAGTSWGELSDSAWRLAHQERRLRSVRRMAKRTWLKTEEKRAQ